MSADAPFPTPPSEEELEHPEADVVAEGILHDRRERSVAALDDAVDYLHDRLDDELPHDTEDRTVREYVREERGWIDETIDALRIGYAPPNPRSLWNHLESAGHEQDAIYGTGLFRERYDPVWKGRTVLPYPDQTGERAAFAISRRIPGREEGDEAGARIDAHPADYNEQAKYHKIRTTYPYVHVEEPIFGVHTVENGSAVIITEGIADAITAHQAGLPCISPVTTRFKHDDREKVRDLLADHDVPRVYIVGDAEPPSVDVTEVDEGRDALTIEQVGPGLSGALDTGTFLADADGVTDDVRIVDLPTPATGAKVDLDDYLARWDGDLRPVLAGAPPVRQHPAYDEEDARRVVETSRALSMAGDDFDPRGDAKGLGGRPSRGSEWSGSDRDCDSDGEWSALFDLSLTDITDHPVGFRGTNPLGHHGGENMTESYYVRYEDGGDVFDVDYKYKVGYTPLSFLLCAAGERHPGTPNGKLSDREIWVAWRYAKAQGFIPDDDPIPRRALVHVALDADLCSADEIEDDWRLPDGVYSDALTHVDAEHGVDPGREPAGGVRVDLLADQLRQVDAVARKNPEAARRLARKKELSWPDTDEARERLFDGIVDVMANSDVAAIDAPTSLGKTFAIATTEWLNHADVTGEEPVVHLHATRDARDEAAEQSAEAGVDYAVLRGRKELCPVCRGDYDHADDEDDSLAITVDGVPASVFIDRLCGASYDDDRPDEPGRGIPASVAHRYVAEYNDQGVELPCESGDETCDLQTQWDGIPRSDHEHVRCDAADHTVDDCETCHTKRVRCNDAGTEGHSVNDCPDCLETTIRCEADDHHISDCSECYDTDPEVEVDVIHATNQLAYVPSLRANTNIVLDEQPDYTVDVPTERLQKAIGAFLREVDAPVTTWEQFVSLADSYDGYGGDIALERDALQHAIKATPEREWFIKAKDAHTLAPALARATWWAIRNGPDANGRLSATVPHEPPRLDAGAHADDGWNREWVTVVLSNDGRIEVETVRDAPDFSNTRSVVGLDAHPAMDLWQRNAVPSMQRRAILDSVERAGWRRFERGLTVVQVGDATRPAGKDGQYLKYEGDDGRDPLYAVIETLRDRYGEEFRTGITASKAEEYFEQALRDCGVDDLETMHYGEEKSRNDFADELIGLVNGCIDPGDDYVLNLLAEADLDAQPKTNECEKCNSDGCGHTDPQCDDGTRRSKGRGFVGPDADHAEAILASVRENHVAQAAGRYARNPGDADDRAVVFVRTDATPVGFVDYKIDEAAYVGTETKRAVVDATPADGTRRTAAEIAEEAGTDREYARQVLEELRETGVNVTVKEGGGPVPHRYGLDGEAPRFGVLELYDGEHAPPETVAEPRATSSGPVEDYSTWSLELRSVGAVDGPLPGENSVGEAADGPPTLADGGGHNPPPS